MRQLFDSFWTCWIFIFLLMRHLPNTFLNWPFLKSYKRFQGQRDQMCQQKLSLLDVLILWLDRHHPSCFLMHGLDHVGSTSSAALKKAGRKQYALDWFGKQTLTQLKDDFQKKRTCLLTLGIFQDDNVRPHMTAASLLSCKTLLEVTAPVHHPTYTPWHLATSTSPCFEEDPRRATFHHQLRYWSNCIYIWAQDTQFYQQEFFKLVKQWEKHITVTVGTM